MAIVRTHPPAPVPVLSRAARRPLGAIILKCTPFVALLFMALLGPSFAPQNPTSVVGMSSSPPSAEFLFGTDSQGLDVFSRTLAAFQVDVFIALAATILATLAGIAVGTLAGMYGDRGGLLGLVAGLIGRSIDIIQAIPLLIASMVIVCFFGRTAAVIALAFAVVCMPFQGRLVRTEVARTRHAGFIEAARMSGESELRLLFRHVMPNSVGGAIENSSAIFGIGLIFCAGLGFLGVGLPLPTAEWGSMIAVGAPDAAVGRWWPVAFPAIFLGFGVWAAAAFISGLALFSKTRR